MRCRIAEEEDPELIEVEYEAIDAEETEKVAKRAKLEQEQSDPDAA